ncbi:MAG: flagellin [Opitutales bacterium]
MSVINTNLQAVLAARNLDQTQGMLDNSLNRLSSGSKIANPADDPGGLAVSDKLNSQSLRIQAATTNVQNAVSYVQTADGFMGGMTQILTRLSQLATLAQDPTKSASDVALYQQEFQGLQDQLRSTIGGTTAQIGGTSGVASPLGTFEGVNLFQASAGISVTIGPDVGQNLTIKPTDLTATGSGMSGLITQDGSGTYALNITSAGTLGTIDAAIQQIATGRADLGASQSRLDLAATNLQVQGQNMSAAISRISDVDVAAESTQMSKYNILVQAGTAMLAQANQLPSMVLKLLH